MRQRFPEFLRPSDDEFSQLWKNCVFVFDTNVLLDLYRLRKEARVDFVKLLKSISKRLWIPHQVGLEFYRNRRQTISKARTAYGQWLDGTAKALGLVDRMGKAASGKDPVPPPAELVGNAKTALVALETALKTGSEEQNAALPAEESSTDPILVELEEVVGGNVGSAWSPQELALACEEAESRFALAIPPGFEDAGKVGIDKFGDYFVWRQTLQFAAKNKKSVILVTDDGKADWWLMEGSRVAGPLPELRREFNITTGQQYYQYSSSSFAELAQKHLAQPVQPETVTELRELQEGDLLEQQTLAATLAALRGQYEQAMFARSDAMRLLAAQSAAEKEAVTRLHELTQAPSAVLAQLRELDLHRVRVLNALRHGAEPRTPSAGAKKTASPESSKDDKTTKTSTGSE